MYASSRSPSTNPRPSSIDSTPCWMPASATASARVRVARAATRIVVADALGENPARRPHLAAVRALRSPDARAPGRRRQRRALVQLEPFRLVRRDRARRGRAQRGRGRRRGAAASAPRRARGACAERRRTRGLARPRGRGRAPPILPAHLDGQGGIPEGDGHRHRHPAARRAEPGRWLGHARAGRGGAIASPRSAVDRSEFVVRHGALPPMPAGYRDVVLDDDDAAPLAPIERFRRTSLGTVFAAGLFGLRDVLEPPKDETPAIVENWAGGEPFNEPDRVAARPRSSRGLDRDGPPLARTASRRSNSCDVSSLVAVSRSRAIVQRASRSGMGSTPKPGPVGTRSRPSSSTKGSVMSPSTPKKRSDAEQSPARVKPGSAATASSAARPTPVSNIPPGTAATARSTQSSCTRFGVAQPEPPDLDRDHVARARSGRSRRERPRRP